MTSGYIAVIPAYQPDRRMLGVIADLGKAGMDVVLVDDGSGREYEALFAQACERLPGRSGGCVTLLTHEENRGKGEAIKTGLEHIRSSCGGNSTVIVTVDADGQHMTGDVIRAAGAAVSSPGTLVLGSRGFDSNVPVRSRIGNSVTRGVFRLVTGTFVHDTQTGLRAFTAGMIPQLLDIEGSRYEYEINMLMEMTRSGTPVIEVPAQTIYMDGNSSSHFDTLKDSFRIYREIGRYFATHTLRKLLGFSVSSFVSFLIDYALYALLILCGAGIIAANISARLVSATANYTINRRLVFRSKASVPQSAARYFVLAAIILAGNTIVLSTLCSAGIDRMAAKIITEITFFLISWIVQRYVIFYTEEENAATGDIRRGRETEADLSTGNGRFTFEYRAVRPGRLRDMYCKCSGPIDIQLNETAD